MKVLHIKLTDDESELLYYIAIIEQEAGGMYSSPEIKYNYEVFLEWVNEYREKKLRQPLKHVQTQATNVEEGGIIEHKRMPFIFREVLQIAYLHGMEIVTQAFEATTASEIISLSSLEQIIEGLSIQTSQKNLNDFKLWLCEKRILGITDLSELEKGTVFLDIKDFLNLIEKYLLILKPDKREEVKKTEKKRMSIEENLRKIHEDMLANQFTVLEE